MTFEFHMLHTTWYILYILHTTRYEVHTTYYMYILHTAYLVPRTSYLYLYLVTRTRYLVPNTKELLADSRKNYENWLLVVVIYEIRYKNFLG